MSDSGIASHHRFSEVFSYIDRVMYFADLLKKPFGASMDCTALVWDLTGLAEDKGTAPLKPEQLQTLWNDLKREDCLKAYGALIRLRHSSAQAPAFLKQKLRPVATVEPKHIVRLIADLNSGQFKTRQKALRELSALGDVAEAALRQALRASPPFEVRKRVAELLEKVEGSPEGRRIRWVVRLLEGVGTPEARRLLESLAQGEPRSGQTSEAKAALKRLGRRPRPPR